jgi:hypothetical protein
MNDDIELELRKALRRVPAPDGFTERVMQRLPERAPAFEWWRMAVAAALICVMFLGGMQYMRQRRVQKARATEKQVIFAFTLAAEKLQRVNYRLQRNAPELKLPDKRGSHYEE